MRRSNLAPSHRNPADLPLGACLGPKGRPRALPALLALLMVTIAGCGGMASDLEGLGGGIVDAIACAAVGCRESSTLELNEIIPTVVATQTDAERQVNLHVTHGRTSAFAPVLLSSTDLLTASVDGGAEAQLTPSDDMRWEFQGTRASASATPEVRVVFTRAGVRQVSQVTLPAAFSVLQPVGTAMMYRSSAALAVRLSLSTRGDATATAAGSCLRMDGSMFSVTSLRLAAVAEASVAGAYRLEPADVHAALTSASVAANKNEPATPAVAACSLLVRWSRSTDGVAAPGMSRRGSIRGVRQATHPLTYDARI